MVTSDFGGSKTKPSSDTELSAQTKLSARTELSAVQLARHRLEHVV